MKDTKMPNTASAPFLSVLVLDAKDEVLASAKVTLRVGSQNRDEITIPFDQATGLYVAREVQKGMVTVNVTHDGMDAQSRDLLIGSGENREIFILAEKGQRTFFRGKVRVPVTADDDLIALMLDRKYREGARDLDQLIDSIGAKEMKIPKLAEQAGMRLYRTAGVDRFEALAEMVKHPAVEHAGIVVQMREDGFSFLTREVIVQFRGPRIEEVREIARDYGFSLQRGLVYADGAFVLEWLGNPAELLEVIEKLAAREDVDWAEPSVVVSPGLDAITPGDTLWPGLWDRQQIGLEDAWQSLQDAGLDTFGDPDILLAVWDSGTQTSGGTPTNVDFNGTLSNGQPKVLQSFDFNNMVANNDNPWDPHGSSVAGVSAAMANNPNPSDAQGVVGSAPNVQLMLCAGRNASIDIEVADQYVWMAGFDPQSPLTGFPASPPAKGADVITCSLRPGTGAVLSGTARAALDFVTTFGRGGKGTMCFFSAGNDRTRVVTGRPYGAYEKCFSVAATSLANDGVTEIRATYSGWGQVDFCAPSHDQYPAFHNPPTGYSIWSATHAGQGNLPTTITATTALSTAAPVNATSITVDSTTGLAVGSIIHIGAFGANGSEPAQITAINVATSALTVQGWQGSSTGGLWTGGLVNAHAVGDEVVAGPANHKNNFGGTSSATPLAAGVAALVLSANPSLTYIEAREIMRDTANKLNPGNTTTDGQWLDINGDPSVTSGLPAIRSGWYGFGRIDAAAAVQGAIDYTSSRDLVIRDNLADTGTVATPGAFWNSPDIWCRTSDPASDPAAIPATYAAAGPHQSPIRGQQNWICLRVYNNGSTASLDGWVRISVSHFPGLEFTYPDAWQPTNGPGDPLPSPMTPGTYFIGEAKVSGVPPLSEETVVIPWPSGLVPPATVSTPGGPVNWHPCLLAEITPHDGPDSTGNHVWDDNNLAQKNISIVETDSEAGTDIRVAMVLGNPTNEAECLTLEINRGRLPREVQLYVDLMDRRLLKYMLAGHTGELVEEHNYVNISPRSAELLSLHQLREELAIATAIKPRIATVGEGLPGRLTLSGKLKRNDWRRGIHGGREVIFLEPNHRIRLPLCMGSGRLSTVVIGGIQRDDLEPGEYEIVLVQRQPDGTPSGSATIMVRVGRKQKPFAGR